MTVHGLDATEEEEHFDLWHLVIPWDPVMRLRVDFVLILCKITVNRLLASAPGTKDSHG